jgi:hypothetical protein
VSTMLMDCGHSQNAKKEDGSPYCAICDCSVAMAAAPDLSHRKALCLYHGSKCHSEAESSESLAFFEHLPDSEDDRYYCGCWGWD